GGETAFDAAMVFTSHPRAAAEAVAHHAAGGLRMSTEALSAGASSQTLGEPSCAPLSGWRRMLADTLVVGASTLVCQVLGAVTSLALRMLLDPAEMGIWQGLKTVLSYANFSNLGISKGAAQELAIAHGRGDLAAAQRGLNLAHTINTLT